MRSSVFRPDTISFAWAEGHFHTVRMSLVGGQRDYILARHLSRQRPGGRGVSRTLHAWLTTYGADEVCWRTAEQWMAGDTATAAPKYPRLG